MALFLEIFVSVFFLFGLYCAALEIWRMTKKVLRYFKRRNAIDKEREKS